jgi:hypothetical protein
MENQKHIKIAIPVTFEGKKNTDETLWAFDLGSNKAKIDNIPVYANSLSLSDIVEYNDKNSDSLFEFVKVIEKSGIKTVRIIYKDSLFNNRTKVFKQKLFPELQPLGCSYEGGSQSGFKVISLAIPKEVELGKITPILDKFKSMKFNYEVADNGVLEK